jgi:thiamine biosynthesis protein ThiI
LLVVVHYSEIGLKGRNRPRFEGALRRGLRRALEGVARARIRRRHGRLLLELPDDVSWERARDRLGTVFGVAYFARALRTDPTPEAIERAVEESCGSREFASFGVRARRADKSHPFTSGDLNRRIGAHVLRYRPGARVDLGSPELWIDIHVLSREALVFVERIPGPGGMPVGSAGRALALLSGGIDSPVAAHRMMKRGLELAFVHFHSAPFTSPASQQKVRTLCARLGRWQGRSRLYLVPFGELQRELVRTAPAEPRIVLYRRFMLRLAERLAEREGALALVTGESLGQVSSQTLANLDTINRVATLPVLRPLCDLDKQEIVELAQGIGTFDVSIEPGDDCCSYLMPRQPATWTRPEALEAIERQLDVKGMVEAALARVETEEVEVSHDV